MAKNDDLRSEGEELEPFLAELERNRNVEHVSGWRSGFANLDRALDGILPGVYLCIGRPGTGKTSFARQLLDQIVELNSVPGVFFTFSETANELRLKTLSRLSGIETRELRRGSTYLLHWYGVPKRAANAEELPPSWEKVRSAADIARPWLNLTYLLECGRQTNIQVMEQKVRAIAERHGRPGAMIVIDDSQRLAVTGTSPDGALSHLADELHALARTVNAAVFAIWSDITGAAVPADAWADRAPGAAVVIVFESDRDRRPRDPNDQSIVLNIVKNRGGEKGKLGFAFSPALNRFQEVI